MMRRILGLVCVAAVVFVGCEKKPEPPKAETTTAPAANPAPADAGAANSAGNAAATGAAANNPSGRAVKTEMRNVLFRLTENGGAHLVMLTGELLPIGKNEMPVFDDKNSFEVHVTNGTVSITPEALTDIMNSYVFAKPGAPLKDLKVSIKDGKLEIKGKLHSKGDLPFSTTGTLSANGDGRIRVHTEKVKALGVPVKGVMNKFGIELADVVNTDKVDGLDTDKNDLLMDLGALLPPPHIRGKVAGVKIEGNEIVTTFGDGGKSVTPMEKGNYMAFRGNRVRFGKVTMDNTDLTVLDMDPGDVLDWNQDQYKDQLVAGNAKVTPSFGLRAYVKDYGKLKKK